jgi:hypothetical protein
LHANRRIYEEEDDKIMFFLSYMNDKEALRWKQTFLRSITNERRQMTFPSFDQFIGELQGYFQPTNVEQDAAHQLSILRQGKKTAEEIVTEFRLLTSQAGYSTITPTDHKHLIEKFRRTLNPSLARKIMISPPVPTTINGWVEKAILLDSLYRMTNETLLVDGKARSDKKPPNKSGWTNYFDTKKDKKEHDPDAMDIDRLSPEKRTYLMKKGACFICEEPGHRAAEHYELKRKEEEKKKKASTRRTEATTSKTSSTSKTPKKKDISKIHALLQGLSKEETKELLALQHPEHEKHEKEEKKKEDDNDDSDTEEDF